MHPLSTFISLLAAGWLKVFSPPAVLLLMSFLIQLRAARYSASITSTYFRIRKYTTASLSLLKILPEVSEALSSGKPVVALESTILAHGLPHPDNIKLAQDVGSIIRCRGAIPATIAGK